MNHLRSIVYGSFSIALLMNACVKPEACIDGPTEVLVGETVTWYSCGDGKQFEWSAHDGLNQYSGEGESFSATFDTPTQHGNLNLYVNGSILRGESDASLQFSVRNNGYKLRIVDQNYYQGLTNTEGVAGAEVSLYTSKTCWDNETESEVCLAASGTADADGYVEFPGVNPGTYVVDARGNEVLANWNDNVRNLELELTEEQLYYESQLQVQLEYNGDYYLTSAGNWELTGVRADGVDFWSNISSCSKDNYLVFYKDLTWEYKEGSEVCSESTESSGTYYTGSGSFNSYPEIEGVSIYTEDAEGSFQVDYMNFVDASTIEAHYTFYDQGSGQSTSFVYTFSKE